MDLNKLGGEGWRDTTDLSNTGDVNLPSFKLAESELASVHHVSDLLAITRSRNDRSFLGDRKNFSASASMPALHTTGNQHQSNDESADMGNMSASMSMKKTSTKRRVPMNPLRKPPAALSYTINERPPNRVEISKLEEELEERVKNILYAEESMIEAIESGDMYQPYKDQITVIRNKVLEDLGISENILEDRADSPEDTEPWLHRRVQCECLNDACENINMKLIDMVSVNAAQLGNVLRKLRYTYKQSFEQMTNSWSDLRNIYISSQKEIEELKMKLAVAHDSLKIRDEKVREQVEREVQIISSHFEEEKKRDKESLDQTEAKMVQMSETLSSLNGIFKTMQQESSSVRLMDIFAKCQRLEKENAELENDSLQVGKLKETDKLNKAKIASMTRDFKQKDDEISYLRMELSRRDEVVASLLEKEALRDAEIDKLQKLITLKDKEQDKIELQESATSVLCIKCKKSLDDMSNIRAAAMGKGDSGVLQRCQCEAFRILLPNLKKQPHRGVPWLRTMMRCILFSKIKEDVNILGIKGETCRFPHFVYSWFDRETEGLQGSALTKTFVMNDEDRWGLYYGVKAMARENDPEAMIFWTLLDEKFGEDGMQFISHCMSVILSMGGDELWSQFGDIPDRCSSINMRTGRDGKEGEKVRRFLWLDLLSSKEATKAILQRALSSHIHDCIETINAFLVVPDIQIEREKDEDELEEEQKGDSFDPASTKKPLAASHINLFMWLRLMLQQMHAEQIQRSAAVRLMFDTASIGALTSPLNFGNMGNNTVGSNVGGIDGSQGHVEYPQFNAICKTLFPTMASTEIASFYTSCYEEGKQKVSSNVFQKVADKKCLFSRYMKLASLPLFEQHTPKPPPPLTTEEAADPAGTGAPIVTIISSSSLLSKGPGVAGKLTDESTLRVFLGSLIHRKLAALTPEIQRLMKILPERWRSLLQESLDNVNYALNDSYQKMRKKLGEKVKNIKQQHFIDGIQPFVYYRRLLAVALLVKGFSDNPIIPTEILANKNRDFSANLDIGMSQIEKLLSAMEEGIVLGNSDGKVRQDSKYYRYDFVRKALVIRKLQNVTRNFCNSNVPIPRNIRAHMRRGYLFGETNVRNRTVVYDPWFVQSIVSDIYAFKIQYDTKAMLSRLPCISLPQAIVTYFFNKFGAIDVTERMIHDLLYCSKQYYNLPRLRIFNMLLGIEDGEVDEGVREVFKSPQALGVYLDFLARIHEVLAMSAKAKAKTAAAEANTDTTVSGSAAVTVANLGEQPAAASTLEGDSKEDVDNLFSKPNSNLERIFKLPYDDRVFIPSSINPFDKNDRRDIWLIEPEEAAKVVSIWSVYQKGIESCPNIYIEMVQKLKPSLYNGKSVDADELSWLMMLQWARVVIYYTKRCDARASWSDRFNPSSVYGAIPTSPLASDFMPTLLETVYRPGEGSKIADGHNVQTLYVSKAMKRKFIHSQPEKGSTSTLDFLKSCVLWDISNSNDADLKSDTAFYTIKSGINFAISYNIGRTVFERYREPCLVFVDECLSRMTKAIGGESGSKVAEVELEKALVDIVPIASQISTLLSATQQSPDIESNQQLWVLLKKMFCAVETARMAASKYNMETKFPEDSWTSLVNGRRPAIFSRVQKSPAYAISAKANIA